MLSKDSEAQSLIIYVTPVVPCGQAATNQNRQLYTTDHRFLAACFIISIQCSGPMVHCIVIVCIISIADNCAYCSWLWLNKIVKAIDSSVSSSASPPCTLNLIWANNPLLLCRHFWEVTHLYILNTVNPPLAEEGFPEAPIFFPNNFILFVK